ncbi:endo-1,4-beta-xylanase 4-like [Ipomoea triloba]|uniref:endo-1,4-beta-xylanase 4-like n=1 Tax=Ipomoea triloba TaxID=35885 RepID=UPI00125CEFB6|nr:endo-1,4-beta-xylanase 4-like [Ipomoea triloba]
MAHHFLLSFIVFVAAFLLASSQDFPKYDYSAPTECKQLPDEPLYGGGILKGQEIDYIWVRNIWGYRAYVPSVVLPDLIPGLYYSFSCWVKIVDIESTILWVVVGTKETCGATVIAREGCWSFLKGGFYLEAPLNTSVLHFEDYNGGSVHIDVESMSLQQFTEEQWRAHQDEAIQQVRKRNSIITVSDQHGAQLQGANIKVEQISRDFPFGVAISQAILDNPSYQEWFKKRFTVTVFENEMKWPENEPRPGTVNFATADKMVEFVKKNKIPTRGHNVIWQDPVFTPSWARNLTGQRLRQFATSRLRSVMERYKDTFIHWDVNNEMLHYDFYERRLENPKASLEFYHMAQAIDPNTTLFMNDFRLVESCGNGSNVDGYIAKIREFQLNGIKLLGMGLEGHFFDGLNPVFSRAVMDKFATVGVPVWLTEVDVNITYGVEKQAQYLERVLREGYAHPGIGGIVIWAAINPYGACWQMCLTDKDFNNTPVGDVVDKLLAEWHTGTLTGKTDSNGSFSFSGFLGNYRVTVEHPSRRFETTVSLSKGVGPQQFQIHM